MRAGVFEFAGGVQARAWLVRALCEGRGVQRVRLAVVRVCVCVAEVCAAPLARIFAFGGGGGLESSSGGSSSASVISWLCGGPRARARRSCFQCASCFGRPQALIFERVSRARGVPRSRRSWPFATGAGRRRRAWSCRRRRRGAGAHTRVALRFLSSSLTGDSRRACALSSPLETRARCQETGSVLVCVWGDVWREQGQRGDC